MNIVKTKNTTPHTSHIEGMLEDIRTLLKHPEYRHHAEPILKEAMAEVAFRIM